MLPHPRSNFRFIVIAIVCRVTCSSLYRLDVEEYLAFIWTIRSSVQTGIRNGPPCVTADLSQHVLSALPSSTSEPEYPGHFARTSSPFVPLLSDVFPISRPESNGRGASISHERSLILYIIFSSFHRRDICVTWRSTRRICEFKCVISTETPPTRFSSVTSFNTIANVLT